LPGSGFRPWPVWLVFPLAPVPCSSQGQALGFPPSTDGRPSAFARFSATTTGSDLSWPCIIGYGSMPSRCGPDGTGLWSATRSPGSRARSVRTCQCLRPRGVVGRLAVTPPAMLPSAVSTASAPRSRLSRLNGWPMRSPVNASPRPRGSSTHDSGPVWIATPSLRWILTTYSLPVSRRTESTATRPPQDEDIS
jgi:hypothetical protein